MGVTEVRGLQVFASRARGESLGLRPRPVPGGMVQRREHSVDLGGRRRGTAHLRFRRGRHHGSEVPLGRVAVGLRRAPHQRFESCMGHEVWPALAPPPAQHLELYGVAGLFGLPTQRPLGDPRLRPCCDHLERDHGPRVAAGICAVVREAPAHQGASRWRESGLRSVAVWAPPGSDLGPLRPQGAPQAAASDGPVQLLEVSLCGKWLASAGFRLAYVWNAHTGHLERELNSPPEWPKSLAIAVGGTSVVVGSGQLLHVWRRGATAHTLAGFRSFALMPTGDGLVAITASGAAAVVDLDTPGRMRLLDDSGISLADGIWRIRVSSDGRVAAVCGTQSGRRFLNVSLVVWNAVTGCILHTSVEGLEPHAGQWYCSIAIGGAKTMMDEILADGACPSGNTLQLALCLVHRLSAFMWHRSPPALRRAS
eukprot:CAMPEP_0176064802 /NCGR_PEP_ID=MMETSP0120_2-20121206/32325_1 /TAXON_ID=160619 /ORGANISM="Kryptoperidinium foliaceum, Strain CCMP 1326" /LENGTH=423 /DNA_ID=CAMNT_0017398383 /DNA_START=92 /DNA_END=1362 /DNA_ORIENTATION=-